MKRKSLITAFLTLILGFVVGACATFGLAASQGSRTSAAYLQTEMYRFYDAYTLANIRDSKPKTLADSAISRAQFRTIKIAQLFDQLDKDQQRDALHIFARLDDISSIRSDGTPLGKSAARARAEVEKTHKAIREADINLNGD